MLTSPFDVVSIQIRLIAATMYFKGNIQMPTTTSLSARSGPYPSRGLPRAIGPYVRTSSCPQERNNERGWVSNSMVDISASSLSSSVRSHPFSIRLILSRAGHASQVLGKCRNCNDRTVRACLIGKILNPSGSRCTPNLES